MHKRTQLVTLFGLLLLALSHAGFTETARAAEIKVKDARPVDAVTLTDTEVPVLQVVRDPIEPFNRSMGFVNHGLMKGIIGPANSVYRFVLPTPVRTAFGRFGSNLEYPRRLINNVLQGKLSGAASETGRFAVNTTLGCLGLFDMASRLGIEESDEDFGQTLGAWGWSAQMYLLLPILGPGNERDLVGTAADILVNPATYVFPLLPLLRFNSLSSIYDDYIYYTTTEYDPYEFIRYGWSLNRKEKIIDYSHPPDYDDAVQTLETVFLTADDPTFGARAKTHKAVTPATGRTLPYSIWLQPERAPVVFFLPGLGVHRLSRSSVAMAELLYRQGFSVVVISNVMNFEFIGRALSNPVPGFAAADVHDVLAALDAVRSDLDRRYHGRFSSSALAGVSLGGFHTLLCAALAPDRYDRYVSIYTPVSLRSGLHQLDAYYQAPLAWPADQRVQRMENTLMKAIDLSNGSIMPEMELPFTSTEARYLIGLSFRFSLRDIVFQSASRWPENPWGINARVLSRRKTYRDILDLSFDDFYNQFLVPYYTQAPQHLAAEDMKQQTDLRYYEASLRENQNIRIFVNDNDFVLNGDDLGWLSTTFEPDRLAVFENGGHMGNLHKKEVQDRIMHAFDGLH